LTDAPETLEKPQAVRRMLLRQLFGAAVAAPLIGALRPIKGAPTAPLPSWQPPALQSPRTIDIGSDPTQSFIDLDSSTDYLIRIGPNSDGKVVRHALRLRGGRNIVLIGGYVRRSDDTPTNSSDGARTRFPGELLTVGGHSGTAYVEGLLLDTAGNYGVDGLHVGSASGGTYVFRNIHIRGISGTTRGNHADGVQIVGSVDALLIDGMTVYSSYQGINIQPEFPIGLAWLRNCNSRYPDPDYRHGSANGYSFWLGDSGSNPKLKQPAHYRFENVFVEERTHFWDESWENGSVGPPAKAPGGCRLLAGRSDQVGFPQLQVEGYLSRGIPPGGDFCPASSIIDDADRVVYRRA